MTHHSRFFAVDISESCVYSFETLVPRQSEIRPVRKIACGLDHPFEK